MMEKIIKYQDLPEDHIMVDVRTPSEYADHTIPGAINVPLFSDEERKIIGTAYKHESVEKATRLGIEIISQRLPKIYDEFAEIKKKNKQTIVFCARGGMRSRSVCALFNSLGIHLWQLWGGYKSYRQIVWEELPKINSEITYLVLHGFTGTGKTEILYQLAKMGADILDLEKAANHRGSLFGSVGLGKTNSQKQFEALIYQQLKERKSNSVFVEAESKKIGRGVIPEYIFEGMQQGKHLLVEGSVETRARRIVDEYIQGDNYQGEILAAVGRLKVYLGEKIVRNLQEQVLAENYYEISKYLIENYYDPMYQHKQKAFDYDLVVNSDEIDNACEEILNWLTKDGNK